MIDIKVIDIIKSLSKYEMNRFIKYVKSPFYNENETLVELLLFYTAEVKKYGKVDYSKQEIWASIFPYKSYDDRKFRRFNSDLSKLGEGFLAHKVYHENPIKQATDLLNIINRRNIDKLRYTTHKNAINHQKKWTLRNAEYYYHQYLLETEYHVILESQSRTNHNIVPAIQNLDYFYLGEKLRLYCTLLNYKNVVASEEKLLFIDEILAHLDKANYDEIPAVSVYYQVLKTLNDKDNEQHYFDLRDTLSKHASKFPDEEARNLYILAQNYCIKKINSGNSSFLNELLTLYKKLLETKLIFQEEILSPWTFKNVITIALRVGELDWAKQFIEGNYEKIPEEFRDNAYNYNLAKYHFYLKNYDNVIGLLNNVTYQGVFYLLDAKSLLIKTYYETKEEQALISLFDSFKVLLNRKKMVSPFYRKIYKNLIKYTKKLVNHRNGNSTKLVDIENQLNTEKEVADLTWLQEKIQELKKR